MMRTLNLNKRPIWQVKFLGEVPLRDEEGLLTGEIKKEYSEPKRIHLNIYSASSDIVQNIFGTTNNIDIVCIDDKVKLDRQDKLFYNRPSEDTDYEKDYDLEVSAISRSLNHWNYGLRRAR